MQRRTAVLDAAQELFLAHGVASTSIEAVARRAGVAKGTVYLYFPSKEHIARELEAQFEGRLVERVRSAAARCGSDAVAAVAAWCVELAEAYLDELEIHDMLFQGRAATPRAGAADDPLVADLTALLTRRRVEAAGDVAAFLVGGTTTLIDHAIVGDRAADRADLTRSVRSVARSAVAQLTAD